MFLRLEQCFVAPNSTVNGGLFNGTFVDAATLHALLPHHRMMVVSTLAKVNAAKR